MHFIRWLFSDFHTLRLLVQINSLKDDSYYKHKYAIIEIEQLMRREITLDQWMIIIYGGIFSLFRWLLFLTISNYSKLVSSPQKAYLVYFVTHITLVELDYVFLQERQEFIIEKVTRNKRKSITTLKGLDLFGKCNTNSQYFDFLIFCNFYWILTNNSRC